jgi:menaquinone-dependent protoporphyrinogen oxidase
MRILVTWGTKQGGTEGIARIIGEQMRSDAVDVDIVPANQTRGLEAYDAVIVGGALYANRWHSDARRFVLRNTRALRRIPVWMFSSGPLDESAEHEAIPPTNQVKALMERIGARGHVTFGGRLAPDARGFAAGNMAKTHAGDWRNPEHIRTWAAEVARELPTAEPGLAIDHPAYGLSRLIEHGVLGGALCAAVMAGLLALTTTGLALALHAIAAPILLVLVSRHYFAPPGAREPVVAALVFTGMAMLALPAAAWQMQGQLTVFTAILGVGLPAALIFASTWLTGFIMSTLPWPKIESTAARPEPAVAHGSGK